MHLPDELLLLISEYVYPSDRFSLLLVCRHWRSLFTNQVYSDIHVSGEQIAPLVHHLHRNPNLGSAIRTIHVEGWCSYLYDPEPRDDDPATLQAFAETASHSTEEAEKWKIDLQEGNTDAWLGILLMFLTDLTVLDMVFPGDSDYCRPMLCRAAYREKPFDTKPALQKLREVHIVYDDMQIFFSASVFIPFFHFPNMRLLHGEGIVEDERRQREGHPALRPAKGTSPIQKIILDTRCNASKGMADFITSCANLQVFEYQHGNWESWSASRIGFRPKFLYDSLLTQKHSLQVLKMNDTGESEENEDDDDQDPPLPPQQDAWFGSLKPFEQLCELRIRIRNLLNFGMENLTPTVSFQDVLPHSLESLFLADYDDSLYSVVTDNLYDLVNHHKEFPHLRMIQLQINEFQGISTGNNTVVIDRDGPLARKATFDGVKRRCGEEGIEFGFYNSF